MPFRLLNKYKYTSQVCQLEKRSEAHANMLTTGFLNCHLSSVITKRMKNFE